MAKSRVATFSVPRHQPEEFERRCKWHGAIVGSNKESDRGEKIAEYQKIEKSDGHARL